MTRSRRHPRALLPAVAAVAMAATVVTAVAVERIVVGPQGNGTSITPNGWYVTPAGRQIDLADSTGWADRPYGQALSPDGRTLLISSGGQSTQSMTVVDTSSATVRQRIPYVSPEALFVGLVWSPDGRHAYAAAGGSNKIRVYDFDGQRLAERSPIPVPNFPIGLAVSADGRTLYAAENRGDALAVINLVTMAVVATVPVGPCDTIQPGGGPQCQPYGVTLSADGARAFVSNWGEHSVTAVDTVRRVALGITAVGTHPNALVVNPRAERHEVYIANGDSDTVSVLDAASRQVTRTVDLAPYAGAPEGSNPSALAVSPDGNTLYVTNAGNNDVDVIGLAGGDLGRQALRLSPVAGMIPTAWYPSGVSVSPDGRTLYVENAKGLGAGPNPRNPGPFGTAPAAQYVGSMMRGTLSIIDSPNPGQLQRFTEQVVRNNGFDERDGVRRGGGPGDLLSLIPRRVGDHSPIQHVIYVIKENRTYDQVFGSLGKGNGDPALNQFGDDSAPNIRRLARTFVTLDNMYANAEVSADGWNWSTAANANSYVQHTWPANYSTAPGRGRGYDFEGGNYATAPNRDPHDAYLWDRLDGGNISFRNYGMWTLGGTAPAVPQPTAPNLARVDPHYGRSRTDPLFPGFNLAISDSAVREPEWERDFHLFEAGGNLPTVELVRLPNDHTQGTRRGQLTPQAYVADNDLALGRLVDTVSHSRYWASTAIFVNEDDAQDGPDHVDAHRVESLVVSPYTQHGRVDSTFYSTVSMLRTMELIVGLRPMTQFDAAATPMLNAFDPVPNLTPYTAVVPSQPLTQVNLASAPMAAQSEALAFDQADAADNRVLNEAIWKATKGPGSTMPEPRNGTFGTRTPPADGDSDGG
jgi:YVTN family beta-propeller protein